MASLLHFIYDIKNPINGGRQSRTSLWSNEQISFNISAYRVTLIKQALDKNKPLDPTLVQNLGKVKIKKVDGKECNCDIKGCSLYKVESTIPKHLLLTFVGSVGGNSFQGSTYSRIRFDQYATYTGKMDKWFKIGDDLYISSPNHNLGKTINIQGVFEDPKATNSYVTCECDNATECYDGFEFEYPLPMSMWDTIKKMFWDAEMRVQDGHPLDNTNNSLEDGRAI